MRFTATTTLTTFFVQILYHRISASIRRISELLLPTTYCVMSPLFLNAIGPRASIIWLECRDTLLLELIFTLWA